MGRRRHWPLPLLLAVTLLAAAWGDEERGARRDTFAGPGLAAPNIPYGALGMQFQAHSAAVLEGGQVAASARETRVIVVYDPDVLRNASAGVATARLLMTRYGTEAIVRLPDGQVAVGGDGAIEIFGGAEIAKGGRSRAELEVRGTVTAMTTLPTGGLAAFSWLDDEEGTLQLFREDALVPGGRPYFELRIPGMIGQNLVALRGGFIAWTDLFRGHLNWLNRSQIAAGSPGVAQQITYIHICDVSTPRRSVAAMPDGGIVAMCETEVHLLRPLSSDPPGEPYHTLHGTPKATNTAMLLLPDGRIAVGWMLLLSADPGVAVEYGIDVFNKPVEGEATSYVTLRTAGQVEVMFAMPISGRAGLAAGLLSATIDLFDSSTLETGGRRCGWLLPADRVFDMVAVTLPGSGYTVLVAGSQCGGVELFHLSGAGGITPQGRVLEATSKIRMVLALPGGGIAAVTFAGRTRERTRERIEIFTRDAVEGHGAGSPVVTLAVPNNVRDMAVLPGGALAAARRDGLFHGAVDLFNSTALREGGTPYATIRLALQPCCIAVLPDGGLAVASSLEDVELFNASALAEGGESYATLKARGLILGILASGSGGLVVGTMWSLDFFTELPGPGVRGMLPQASSRNEQAGKVGALLLLPDGGIAFRIQTISVDVQPLVILNGSMVKAGRMEPLMSVQMCHHVRQLIPLPGGGVGVLMTRHYEPTSTLALYSPTQAGTECSEQTYSVSGEVVCSPCRWGWDSSRGAAACRHPAFARISLALLWLLGVVAALCKLVWEQDRVAGVLSRGGRMLAVLAMRCVRCFQAPCLQSRPPAHKAATPPQAPVLGAEAEPTDEATLVVAPSGTCASTAEDLQASPPAWSPRPSWEAEKPGEARAAVAREEVGGATELKGAVQAFSIEVPPSARVSAVLKAHLEPVGGRRVPLPWALTRWAFSGALWSVVYASELSGGRIRWGAFALLWAAFAVAAALPADWASAESQTSPALWGRRALHALCLSSGIVGVAAAWSSYFAAAGSSAGATVRRILGGILAANMILANEVHLLRAAPHVLTEHGCVPNTAGARVVCTVAFAVYVEAVLAVVLAAARDAPRRVQTVLGVLQLPVRESWAIAAAAAAGVAALACTFRACDRTERVQPPDAAACSAEEQVLVAWMPRYFGRARVPLGRLASRLKTWRMQHRLSLANSAMSAGLFATRLLVAPRHSSQVPAIQAVLALSLAMVVNHAFALLQDRRRWRFQELGDRSFRVSTAIKCLLLLLKFHMLHVPAVAALDAQVEDAASYKRFVGDLSVPVWICATPAACPRECMETLMGNCTYTSPPGYLGCSCEFRGVPERRQRLGVIMTCAASVAILLFLSQPKRHKLRGVFSRPQLGALAVSAVSLLPAAVFAADVAYFAVPQWARSVDEGSVASFAPLAVFALLGNELSRLTDGSGESAFLREGQTLRWSPDFLIVEARPRLEHLLGKRLIGARQFGEPVPGLPDQLQLLRQSEAGLSALAAEGACEQFLRVRSMRASSSYTGGRLDGAASLSVLAPPRYGVVWTSSGVRALVPIAVVSVVAGVAATADKLDRGIVLFHVVVTIVLAVASLCLLVALDTGPPAAAAATAAAVEPARSGSSGWLRAPG